MNEFNAIMERSRGNHMDPSAFVVLLFPLAENAA